MKKYGSKEIIGNVKEVYKNIFRPDRRWDVWRGFYNGWLEGRSNILTEIRKENLVAYEYHNHKTGHCFVEYDLGEVTSFNGIDNLKDYTKIPLYTV